MGDPLSLIGLAARARGIVSGGNLTEQAVQRGEAHLVILAEDASDGTKKRITDKCKYYHVPYVFSGTQESLGHRIGKEARSCIAVTDPNFAAETGKRFGIEMQEV